MRVITKDGIRELVEIVEMFWEDLAKTGFEFQRSEKLPVSMISSDQDTNLKAIYQVAAYQILRTRTDAVDLDEVKTVRREVAQSIADHFFQGHSVQPFFRQQGKEKKAYDLTDGELYQFASFYKDALTSGILDEECEDVINLKKEIRIIATLSAMNILEDSVSFGSGSFEDEGKDILTTIVRNYEDNFRANEEFYSPGQIKEGERKAKAAYRQISKIYKDS